MRHRGRPLDLALRGREKRSLGHRGGAHTHASTGTRCGHRTGKFPVGETCEPREDGGWLVAGEEREEVIWRWQDLDWGRERGGARSGKSRDPAGWGGRGPAVHRSLGAASTSGAGATAVSIRCSLNCPHLRVVTEAPQQKRQTGKFSKSFSTTEP